MFKKSRFVLISAICFSISVICVYAQESLTITTYYPSPYGSYKELETETLYFRETTNGLISFKYPDTVYDRRLRITAGKTDTGNNNQGASIDLHGNSYAGGGRLDLVAGKGSYTSFWTSPAGNDAVERMRITSDGNVGIGTTNPGTNRLEVVGGPIKATGGLIIETRTTDPASPAVGRMWLRTDL